MNPTQKFLCEHCDKVLTSEHDQPCPDCKKYGITLRHCYDEEIQDGFHAMVNEQTRFTDNKTDRTVIHSDSINPTDTSKIEELIIDFVEKASNGFNDYIDQLISAFNSILELTNTVFYKGVNKNIEDKLKPKKVIGLSDEPGNGRYNMEGESCLYLIDNIDNIDFLCSELKCESLLVQQYNIPINGLKIADLSPSNNRLHNSLSLAFQMTERGKTASLDYDFQKILQDKQNNKYAVSQLLASHLKKSEWDGMYIPGVHGAGNEHYHNLVLFSSVANRWEEWVVGEYFCMIKEG